MSVGLMRHLATLSSPFGIISPYLTSRMHYSACLDSHTMSELSAHPYCLSMPHTSLMQGNVPACLPFDTTLDLGHHAASRPAFLLPGPLPLKRQPEQYFDSMY